MFHLIHGYLITHDDRCFIDNALFGIEVVYTGTQTEGSWFIAPIFDQQAMGFRYYAFDDVRQKWRFEAMLKIQGVGGKSAHQLAVLPTQEVSHALETMDLRYFQRLPWIGPKTAKRLLVELKSHFTQDDFQKLTGDQKVADDLITSLKGLGYSVTDIKRLLHTQPYPLERDSMPEIMKWLIDHL